MLSNLEKLKKINSKDVVHFLAFIWGRTYHLILVAVWLGLFAWGGYVWYATVYKDSWNVKIENDLTASRFSDRDLKKASLERMIEDVIERRKQFDREMIPAKDIFKKY